ncbi:beta-glucan synthesis-associated [Coprinellus micaceus]|uniref:Beta-glucan synthesis-associated n=1 Tax=Coprinellus micaceus TaxID=71717 RepID=A0A4Y7SHR4_COPMI|nr:beta-glucan synthesis-associated [Coprinellus micaceus]
MATINRKFTAQSGKSTYSTSSSLRSDFEQRSAGLDLSRVGSMGSMKGSIAEKYSLDASPRTWGTPLDPRTPEPDDDLHNPSSARDKSNDGGTTFFTVRGFVNLGCLSIMAVGLLMLLNFRAGYPLLTHLTKKIQTNQGGFNLGGINSTGQIPDMVGNYGLIDKDTPKSAYSKKSLETGDEMILVFSDEFNVEGRSFYPGDDPYWEAVDLWYWGTKDLEWYDPSQVTTRDGALQITLEQMDPADNHNLTYKSGMLQSWNKFCFTGGFIEASVRLPGNSKDGGLWPALWTLGNLGRAGYGATLEGLWPYSYDSCDIGTLANQTYVDKTGPPAALNDGDPYNKGLLSFLPGQRLSACTCPGESHPGPMRKDGSYVGRAAPEIDVLEAIVEFGEGRVSQSSQWAPYNAGYRWLNTSDNYRIYDDDVTHLNPYAGGVFQQAVSGLSTTNQSCYELEGGCFATYGFEYAPGFDDAYITWVNNGKLAWTHYARGLDTDNAAEIGPRPISQEPMYIITNLGISNGFGTVSEDLIFPATMSIDWIRVYQPANKVKITCDPEDFPTAAYIEAYPEAYSNAELMFWVKDYKQPWPKNKLTSPGCK